ncbi:DUF4397 domain-containing protein, partial [Candidatus Chloroploca sp. M-50]
PEVSVWVKDGASQLFAFEYGDFAGYLGVPTSDLILEVRTADGLTTVASFVAPLATLDLDGAALTVVASGFLNPANNSDGKPFGLFVATAAGGNLIALPAYVPMAKLQIIHNSADAAVEKVDIFVNGEEFLKDVGFRQATAFMDVPAGVDLNIVVAPAGAGIGNGVGPITVNLTENKNYIAIANGIVSATGYTPATAFSLDVFDMARLTAADPANTDLLVFHGSTDAPEVSVWVKDGASQLFAFEYGDFAGYLGVPTSDLILEVRTADGLTTVASFVAPLATLDLDGAALTVVASGFLNPANNSDGKPFGLFVATAAGGNLIALPAYVPMAKLQIIHNSADAAVEKVDIFVNGEEFLKDVGFRQATAFMDVPAGVDLNIVVAPAGAGIGNGVGPITVNLTENKNYIAIANGIVSATGYTPATAFSLDVFDMARLTAADPANTDLLV